MEFIVDAQSSDEIDLCHEITYSEAANVGQNNLDEFHAVDPILICGIVKVSFALSRQLGATRHLSANQYLGLRIHRARFCIIRRSASISK